MVPLAVGSRLQPAGQTCTTGTLPGPRPWQRRKDGRDRPASAPSGPKYQAPHTESRPAGPAARAR